ncbi:ras guanine nucleotide exchange factor domain-containing protein [Sporodiniella umbellata]|nr:ras guanine nucleotide exchange factor domain-containing protein [Sporodiniella umbellata]
MGKTENEGHKVKLIPLQEETKPRKRNNSLIPPEFLTNSEAGRECAALATVFGVPDYIASKSFWEKKTAADQVLTTIIQQQPPSSPDTLLQQHAFPSYVDSVLGPIASFRPLLNPQPSKSFSLPKIPTVSEFDDLEPSPELTRFSSPTLATECLGSPELFDYIVNDQDERFIIWGPDPIALSSSLATCRPSSYAALYNYQHERPLFESFSSNTTTHNRPLARPTSKSSSSSSNSSSSSSSTLALRFSELKKKPFREKGASRSLLKKAFYKKRTQEVCPLTNIPQVIEAATIHKLIEKLPFCLDYTFMTDFFLTYRDFIQAQDLCQLLVSRFLWALKDDEEPRRIVRIRTFVLFRHWLSNYFVHDFLGNYELRSILTDFLNSLSHHPLIKSSPLDQRIVKTLKRVVRRLKKLYYTRSLCSRVKIIAPPPPTVQQAQMGDMVRARLAQPSILRKAARHLAMSGDHHGNMAVQDTRYAPVVVVGSLGMKAPCFPDSPDQPSLEIPEVREAMSDVSHDSLESDISAGQTIPEEEEEEEEEECQVLVTHDEEDPWLREQEETIAYFNGLSKPWEETIDTQNPVGLARKLSRKSIEPRKSIQQASLPAEIPPWETPAVPYNKKKATEEPSRGHFVSLIAEQLRMNMSRDEIEAMSTNARDSERIQRLLEDERRYSVDLRRRRGASVSGDDPLSLGQLDAKSILDARLSLCDSHESLALDSPATIPPPACEQKKTKERSEVSVSRSISTPTSGGKSFILAYRTSRLASQLCLIEKDVLVKVGWEELIHCRWTKMDASGKINLHPGDDPWLLDEDAAYISYTRNLEKKRAEGHGIEHIIQRFNLMCLWVPSEIIKATNLTDRVKIIEKFIKLAVKSKLYSNYATLVQILLGLQSPSVARLDKTWSKVSLKYQKQLNTLAEFTSPMKNWKHIRDSMTEVAEEYGNSPAEVQVEMPGTSGDKKKTKIKIPFGGCIPFLGIYLSDLVFNFEKPRHLHPNLEHQRIYTANTTRQWPQCLNQPLVNFRKYRVIATVIKRVLIFQGLANRYSFEEEPSLKEQCNHLEALDAVTLREWSAKIQ